MCKFLLIDYFIHNNEFGYVPSNLVFPYKYMCCYVKCSVPHQKVAKIKIKNKPGNLVNFEDQKHI